MPIEWTQDLAVGVKIIDEQHKEIFRRVDALLEACKAGKGEGRRRRDADFSGRLHRGAFRG